MSYVLKFAVFNLNTDQSTVFCLFFFKKKKKAYSKAFPQIFSYRYTYLYMGTSDVALHFNCCKKKEKRNNNNLCGIYTQFQSTLKEMRSKLPSTTKRNNVQRSVQMH